MKNRLHRTSFGRHGRRFVVWLAALSLCLNALLPTVAMAIAVEGSQPVVICTPDGYKTVRLHPDGVPLPAHKAHQGDDCTLCYSCGHCAAPIVATKAPLPGQAQTSRLLETSAAHSSTDINGGEARGPPHHA
jgi:hypothetical protein